ncbi:hypothetical protein RHODOSMS8_02202 [Rhodobiaceae bacterium]|nr:hypothetical protein RHODOSMS8_02202 [Rhodobiaceae bacterium]
MDVSAEALISEVTAGDAGPVFFEIVGSRDLPSVLITMKELGFECSQNQCFYSRLSSPEGFGADYVDVVFLSVRFQSDPVRSARDIRAHYFANRLNRLKPTLENEGKPYVRRMED